MDLTKPTTTLDVGNGSYVPVDTLPSNIQSLVATFDIWKEQEAQQAQQLAITQTAITVIKKQIGEAYQWWKNSSTTSDDPSSEKTAS